MNSISKNKGRPKKLQILNNQTKTGKRKYQMQDRKIIRSKKKTENTVSNRTWRKFQRNSNKYSLPSKAQTPSA